MKFPKLAVLLLASWILQGFGWVQSTMAADPVLVVSIEGTDNLVSDVEYLMDATGTSAFGQFFLPTVKNYLQGINGESPIGVVVTLEGGQPKVLGFVPVTDLKRFLGNIEEQVGAAEDAGDGVLELQGPQSIFVKEHNGWAFLGQTVEALDDLPRFAPTICETLRLKASNRDPDNLDRLPRFHLRMVGMQTHLDQASFADLTSARSP